MSSGAESQEHEPQPGVSLEGLDGLLLLGGGLVARPLDGVQVVELGREEVRAVEARERLPLLHPLAGLRDEQLLDPPGDPARHHGGGALVRRHHPHRPQGGRELLQDGRRRSHADELLPVRAHLDVRQAGDLLARDELHAPALVADGVRVVARDLGVHRTPVLAGAPLGRRRPVVVAVAGLRGAARVAQAGDGDEVHSADGTAAGALGEHRGVHGAHVLGLGALRGLVAGPREVDPRRGGHHGHERDEPPADDRHRAHAGRSRLLPLGEGFVGGVVLARVLRVAVAHESLPAARVRGSRMSKRTANSISPDRRTGLSAALTSGLRPARALAPTRPRLSAPRATATR